MNFLYEAARSTTSRLFGCNTETLERYAFVRGHLSHTLPLGCVQSPFSGGGLVVGAGRCLQCCRRQRPAGLRSRATGELRVPHSNAARSAVCAAAIMVVNGRSGPAPNMTRPASGPGAGADWFHASGFTLSFPAELATFPMHGWAAGMAGLTALPAEERPHPSDSCRIPLCIFSSLAYFLHGKTRRRCRRVNQGEWVVRNLLRQDR